VNLVKALRGAVFEGLEQADILGQELAARGILGIEEVPFACPGSERNMKRRVS